MVKVVNDSSDIPSSGKVVIDFYANWCGPCKKFAPKFEDLSKKEEFKSVTFLKVDVDENELLSQKYDISSLPTFVFVKDNKILFRLEGARESDFISYLLQLKDM